ncbi:MAG: hypothetical protein IPN64_13795 [Propionivibrio sp.]|uniref:hypothetical protein n=1 Tax=Propionivibrio sp. TaxID=2212460 RepID=UPI0025EFB7AB|nr:hypothetical protein [Propionivibrio sp.]MBK8895057.1 hypothetical protein [Propionivibrio sp.]
MSTRFNGRSFLALERRESICTTRPANAIAVNAGTAFGVPLSVGVTGDGTGGIARE